MTRGRPAHAGRRSRWSILGNIVGGASVTYLNVEPGVMKKAAIARDRRRRAGVVRLRHRQEMRRDLGIWDADLFDYGALYDATFTLDKAARLDFHETQMTHAMLFTGRGSGRDSPRRWRVENSWGDENGDKGFYTMNDSWFDEYVFEIAVRRDRLSARTARRPGRRSDRPAGLGSDGSTGRLVAWPLGDGSCGAMTIAEIVVSAERRWVVRGRTLIEDRPLSPAETGAMRVSSATGHHRNPGSPTTPHRP